MVRSVFSKKWKILNHAMMKCNQWNRNCCFKCLFLWRMHFFAVVALVNILILIDSAHRKKIEDCNSHSWWYAIIWSGWLIFNIQYKIMLILQRTVQTFDAKQPSEYHHHSIRDIEKLLARYLDYFSACIWKGENQSVIWNFDEWNIYTRRNKRFAVLFHLVLVCSIVFEFPY